MKKLYLFLICFLLQSFVPQKTLFAQHIDSAKSVSKDAQDKNWLPKSRGWVSDYQDLFSDMQEAFLDSVIVKHERETTNEIVIVTIDRPDLDTNNFETFVTMLFNYWEVGKKETNNGVMICILPRLRRIRIQTGPGIEKIMTDEETKAIIDDWIVPEFKEGGFFKGTKIGLIAIIEQTRQR